MHTTRHRHLSTPLGDLCLVRSAQGLCGAWFCQEHRHAPPLDRYAAAHDDVQDPLLQAACTQIQAYWNGQHAGFDLPLDLSAGTDFQQAVWHQLRQLGPGQWTSYGTIARAMGNPEAARAVGAAVGRNPISIVVPCHRVLGSGGQLTGYAGGLWRKQALLQLEGLGHFA